MNPVTLRGCVTGDVSQVGNALCCIERDQDAYLCLLLAPLDAPSWISTGRTINVPMHSGDFQAQTQTMRGWL